MKAQVYITLKPGLLDAQGKTIKSALESLGFKGVRDIRMGKYIEIELNGARPGSSKGRAGGPATAAKKDVERMCQKLLANPVIETYRIEIAQGWGLGAGGKSLSRTPRAQSPEPRARLR